MANPNTPQGTLNRLKSSLVIPNLPQLNVTASFLDRDGIGIAFSGQTTLLLPTMTGTVTSPEPFIMSTIMVRLLRTQQLSDLYKQQWETNSLLGDITARPDSTTLSPFQILNCAIETVGELVFNGQSAGFGVQLAGYYPVNNSLWD
jgi:hypothetical protein